jgi:hypothetical protein
VPAEQESRSRFRPDGWAVSPEASFVMPLSAHVGAGIETFPRIDEFPVSDAVRRIHIYACH